MYANSLCSESSFQREQALIAATKEDVINKLRVLENVLTKSYYSGEFSDIYLGKILAIKSILDSI